MRAGARASKFITRISTIVGKPVPKTDPPDISDMIRAIVALGRSKVKQHGVSLQGDRVKKITRRERC